MLSVISFPCFILLIVVISGAFAGEPLSGCEEIWDDANAIRLRLEANQSYLSSEETVILLKRINELNEVTWDDANAIRHRLEPDQPYLMPDKTFALLKRLKELGQANDEEQELIEIYHTREEDCDGAKLDKFEEYRTKYGEYKTKYALVVGHTHTPKAIYMTKVISNYHKVCDELFYRQLSKVLEEKIGEAQLQEIDDLIETFRKVRPSYLTQNFVSIETREMMMFQRGSLRCLKRKGRLNKKLLLDKNRGRENFKEIFDQEIIGPCKPVQENIRPLFKRFMPKRTNKIDLMGLHYQKHDLLKDWWAIQEACSDLNRKNGADIVYDYWIEEYTNFIQRGYFKFVTGLKDKKPPVQTNEV